LKWSFLGDLPTHQPFRALEVMLVSMLAENSSFCWTKNPPPFGGDGLHVPAGWVKMKPAGEAEAGSAGVQPAEE
jgi:hypothetical protein